MKAASTIAPTAPIEAASVGVAKPARIEPSTATISSSGGISARTKRRPSEARCASSITSAGQSLRPHERQADDVEDVERHQGQARQERAGEQVADRDRIERACRVALRRELVGAHQQVADEDQDRPRAG